jgi:hypothetical protein
MATAPIPSPRRLTALVVGGLNDVFRKISAHLELYDIEATNHWEGHQASCYYARKRMPRVDMVVILTDNISHNAYNMTLDAAKKAGVQIVLTKRRKVQLDQDLAINGFRRRA